jgi:hypothetical protein
MNLNRAIQFGLSASLSLLAGGTVLPLDAACVP